MPKAKWKVQVKYEMKGYVHALYEKNEMDPEDFKIEEFNEVEISVVREDNKIGIESYGWEDLNKIVLFDSDNVEFYEEDIKWCKQVAKTVCEALNRKGL